jgi:hypothetical protein
LSFGDQFKNMGRIQEVLVIGLMIVFMFALIYLDIDFTLKIGIAGLAFAIIILALIASQLLALQKEAAKQQ